MLYNVINKANTYKVKTAPAALPVSLATARYHLKATSDDVSDDYLTLLIETARNFVEACTGRTLINTTFTTYRDNFPTTLYNPLGTSSYFCENSEDISYMFLYRSKLQSVTSVKYYKDDVLTTFDASKYYITDETDYSRICLVDGESWPDDVDSRMQAVQIEFVAGYGAASSSIPSDLISVILQIVANLYVNRGDCSIDNPEGCIDLPGNTILSKYRIYDLVIA